MEEKVHFIYQVDYFFIIILNWCETFYPFSK